MLKISTIAAGVLALSASVAMAQTTWLGGWAPQVRGDAPADAKMTSPMRDTEIQSGPDVAAAPELIGGPHRVFMTDEYGFRYDSRGDRLDRRGNVISPQTR